MKISKLASALAPTGSRGRHEASWRPLPPGRYRRSVVRKTLPSRSSSLMGVITACTLIGSTMAVAAPGTPRPDPEFVMPEEAVAVVSIDALAVADDVEFQLPPQTVHTFVTQSTVEDLEFSELRLLTTTTTELPPTPEELASLAEMEASSQRRVQAMTAVGFEADVTSVVEEFPHERPAPTTGAECRDRAREIDLTPNRSWDRTAIAQMTWSLFDCVLTVKGLDDVAPTQNRTWNGATRWGFESLAEQMAAEAVVVSYCESIGYRPSALTGTNGYGYGGLFQMGTTEMRRFGAGGSRFDPVDNAYGAVNYVYYQYSNRNGYGGWSPWAVVNTGFDDEVNNQVKVPILPRFRSVDPDYRGRRGPELPQWAVSPWLNDVPSWQGCPYNGGRW